MKPTLEDFKEAARNPNVCILIGEFGPQEMLDGRIGLCPIKALAYSKDPTTYGKETDQVGYYQMYSLIGMEYKNAWSFIAGFDSEPTHPAVTTAESQEDYDMGRELRKWVDENQQG